MKTNQINQDMLQSLYAGCKESINEVFSEFLVSYPAIREKLLETFNTDRIEDLKKLLHYHGPTFMYLGLPEIFEYIKKLEYRCSTVTNIQSINNEFKVLLQMVEEGREIIAKEMGATNKMVA